jgi:hypothetical protein
MFEEEKYSPLLDDASEEDGLIHRRSEPPNRASRYLKWIYLAALHVAVVLFAGMAYTNSSAQAHSILLPTEIRMEHTDPRAKD